MQPLGGDRNLGTQAQLAAICEAGAGVDIDRCRIHFGNKTSGMCFVVGQDAIRVGGAVLLNMGDRFVQPRNHLQTQDQGEPLDIEIIGAGGWSPRRASHRQIGR